MTEITKTIPSTLEAEKQYAVRVRSINGLGVPSAWSESLVVDTTAAGLASAKRLVVNNDGMVAYDSNGRIMFNYASNTPAIRTNLVLNPSFEQDLTGWIALSNSSISRITSDYFIGQTDPGRKASMLVTASATASNVGFVTDIAQRPVASGGLNYTVSMYVKVPASQTKKSFKVGLRFYDSGGTLISEQVSVTARDIDSTQNWVRLSFIAATAPAGTAKLGVVAYVSSQMTTGQNWQVDAVMVEQSSILRDYFDGSTSPGTSSWTGTANSSSSTLDTSSIYSVNGGVFTESTIQTSRTPNTTGGVRMSISGVEGWNSVGTRKFFLDATTGDLTLTGGSIRSGDYAYVSGNFSTAGTEIDLTNGRIRSKNFAIDAAGNAYFAGTLSGAGGTFSGTVTAGSSSFGPNVQPGKNGLYINAHNYWYDNGSDFKVGNATHSILWNGSNLALSGSISSTATITGGTVQTGSSGDYIAMTSNTLTLTSANLSGGAGNSKIVFASGSGYAGIVQSANSVCIRGRAGSGVEANIYVGDPSLAKISFNIAGSDRSIISNAGFDAYVPFYCSNTITSASTITGNVLASNNYVMAKSGSAAAFNSNNAGYTFGGDNDSGMFNDTDGWLSFALNGTTYVTFSQPATGFFINSGILPTATGTHTVKWDSAYGQLYIQASSAKFKENIIDIPDHVDNIIKNARPVQFNWKARNKEDENQKAWREWDYEYGFIVEELAEVDPHIVRWSATSDGEGLEPASWDSTAMCAVLMSAVQKLTARIEDLESRL